MEDKHQEGMFKRLLSLAYDSLIYGGSNTLGQIINFFLLPLYTFFLTPADNGVIAMLEILSQVFSPLANLGMTNAIFRRFNLEKDPDKKQKVLSTGLVSITFVAIMLATAGTFLAGPLARALSLQELGNAERLIRITLWTACLASVNSVPLVMLRAMRRVTVIGTLNLAKIPFNVLFGVLFVVVYQWGVPGYVLGRLIVEALTAAVQLWITRRHYRWSWDRQTWVLMNRYGIPFTPHHLQAVGLVQFGQYMINTLLGKEAGGLYSIAAKFGYPMNAVINAIQASWTPYKFQVHAQEGENSQKTFRSMVTYYFAGVAYLWVGVSLWGPDTVRLMTNAQYHAGAPLVAWTSFITLAMGCYFMMSTGIELSDSTRAMPLVSFAGLVTVVGLAFPLIAWLQAYGAAMATALGWIAMAAMSWRLAQRHFPIRYDWSSLGMLAATAFVFVAIGQTLQAASIWLRLPLLVLMSLLYPVLAFLFLCRSTTERARMLALIQKVRNRFAPKPPRTPADISEVAAP